MSIRYAISLSIKNNPDHLWIAIGFAGSLLAYTLYVMSSFHVIMNILWLLLALAWANNLTPKSPRSYVDNIRLKTLPLIVIVVLLPLSYYSIINPLLAVNVANKGLLEFYQGEITESIDSFERSLAYKSFVSTPIRMHSSMLAVNSPAIDQESTMDDFYDYVTKVADGVFVAEPYNGYYYLLYGIHYGRLAEFDPSLLEKAEYYFKKSAELSPKQGEAYFQWGKMYFDLEDMTKAKIKLERALLLIPNNKEVYNFVGSFYILTGSTDRGIELLQKAIELKHVIDIREIKVLLDNIEEPEEKQKLEQFYQSIIKN